MYVCVSTRNEHFTIGTQTFMFNDSIAVVISHRKQLHASRVFDYNIVLPLELNAAES